jgi:putative ubiquitin-RnfH superfamily antitoxin RatB of RatAB toxin-antitoxin module
MASLRIEVVYALAGRQQIVELRLHQGATAGEAVRLSGMAGGGIRLGIGGKEIAADRTLRDGDRVELLRPLAADPKDARRKRARAAASAKRRGSPTRV